MIKKLVYLIIIAALLFSFTPANAVPPGDTPGGNPVQPDGPTGKPTRPAGPIGSLDQSTHVMIRLKDAPLATYGGGISGMPATQPEKAGTSRLDLNSNASQAYTRYLNGQQSAFINRLQQAVPGADVNYRYTVVFNGLSAKVKLADIPAIQNLPGVVAVTPERHYETQMDTSLKQIGLGSGTLGGSNWEDAGLWKAVGGHQNAGKGLKVADIDSGITPNHPCFDPAGYSYPSGFPKYDPGYSAYVSPKIIAARAYFRQDDPPQGPPTPVDDPGEWEGGHGTHTAGTIACNYGTTTNFSGLKISGVAPRAQLMVYRVFYRSVSGQNGANTPQLVAAIEDAVMDGADVVNNSWGGTAVMGSTDPEVMAYTAAVEAGVVVVFSAGNAGPGFYSIGNPGTGSPFITVGASTTSRTFKTTVSAVSRSDNQPIPANLKNISARSLTQKSAEGPIVDLEVAGDPYPEGCSPLQAGQYDKMIVMVKRGTCALVDKVSNAKAGGAVGVIIRNVAGGQTNQPLINPVLPTAHITEASGDQIKAALEALPNGVTMTFKIAGPAVIDPNGEKPDELASFSSKGPDLNLTVKPDLTAPGVNILSSVSPLTGDSKNPSFDFYQGTSMAAPHVSGAAALVRQLHPDWTPAEIKSALVTTTSEPADLGIHPMERGAGRLDLTSPASVALTFDQVNLSFQIVKIGGKASIKITVHNVTGQPVTYKISLVNQGAGPDTPTLSAPTITVPANGLRSFSLSLTATTPGDIFGKVVLTDAASTNKGPTLHIPYWARKLPDLGAGQVLLVDDDGSNIPSTPSTSCTDYSQVYRDTLQNLEIPFAYTEVSPPPGFVMQVEQFWLYDKIILFTGDAQCGGNLSFYGAEMAAYLANGGKMILTGQDIALADAIYARLLGVSFNPQLYFGAQIIQDSEFGNGTQQPPQPTVSGDVSRYPFMIDQIYDLSDQGNGAGNQTSIDELAALNFTDVDANSILQAAPSNNRVYQGTVGTSMTSEPTLERVMGTAPWTQLGYRTIFLSFGLEGVNNDTGFNTRKSLLHRLLLWLDDTVSVHITPGSYVGTGPGSAITVSASANTSVTAIDQTLSNQIILYRWDFGDGTPIQETDVPQASHSYNEKGSYPVRVEVIDIFGHHAVSDPFPASTQTIFYFPLILK